VPSVLELTEGDGPRADLCNTLAWAMRAPIDVAAEARNSGDEEGGATLALEVLERLYEARKVSAANGMAPDEVANCLEQVGRALLLQNVDEAVSVVGSEADLREAATTLCLFARNAALVAKSLEVEDRVAEVLYEGAAPRRRLERLYASCLELAAPELLASMGMGEGDSEAADGMESPVSLDTVEALRPLLKLRENKAQRIMQEVVQKQMMAMMGEGGDSPDGGGKAMARSVEMLEQLLDSGAVGEEDLESLKGMLAQSMGMPIDEILERKEELQKELPPEGKRLFDLIERIYKPATAAGPADAGVSPPEEEEDADGMTVTVRTGVVVPPPTPSAGTVNVKVKVKKAEDPATANAAEEAAAPPPAELAAPTDSEAVAAAESLVAQAEAAAADVDSDAVPTADVDADAPADAPAESPPEAPTLAVDAVGASAAAAADGAAPSLQDSGSS